MEGPGSGGGAGGRQAYRDSYSLFIDFDDHSDREDHDGGGAKRPLPAKTTLPHSSSAQDVTAQMEELRKVIAERERAALKATVAVGAAPPRAVAEGGKPTLAPRATSPAATKPNYMDEMEQLRKAISAREKQRLAKVKNLGKGRAGREESPALSTMSEGNGRGEERAVEEGDGVQPTEAQLAERQRMREMLLAKTKELEALKVAATGQGSAVPQGGEVGKARAPATSVPSSRPPTGKMAKAPKGLKRALPSTALGSSGDPTQLQGDGNEGIRLTGPSIAKQKAKKKKKNDETGVGAFKPTAQQQSLEPPQDMEGDFEGREWGEAGHYVGKEGVVQQGGEFGAHPHVPPLVQQAVSYGQLASSALGEGEVDGGWDDRRGELEEMRARVLEQHQSQRMAQAWTTEFLQNVLPGGGGMGGGGGAFPPPPPPPRPIVDGQWGNGGGGGGGGVGHDMRPGMGGMQPPPPPRPVQPAVFSGSFPFGGFVPPSVPMPDVPRPILPMPVVQPGGDGGGMAAPPEWFRQLALPQFQPQVAPNLALRPGSQVPGEGDNPFDVDMDWSPGGTADGTRVSQVPPGSSVPRQPPLPAPVSEPPVPPSPPHPTEEAAMQARIPTDNTAASAEHKQRMRAELRKVQNGKERLEMQRRVMRGLLADLDTSYSNLHKSEASLRASLGLPPPTLPDDAPGEPASASLLLASPATSKPTQAKQKSTAGGDALEGSRGGRANSVKQASAENETIRQRMTGRSRRSPSPRDQSTRPDRDSARGRERERSDRARERERRRSAEFERVYRGSGEGGSARGNWRERERERERKRSPTTTGGGGRSGGQRSSSRVLSRGAATGEASKPSDPSTKPKASDKTPAKSARSSRDVGAGDQSQDMLSPTASARKQVLEAMGSMTGASKDARQEAQQLPTSDDEPEPGEIRGEDTPPPVKAAQALETAAATVEKAQQVTPLAPAASNGDDPLPDVTSSPMDETEEPVAACPTVETPPGLVQTGTSLKPPTVNTTPHPPQMVDDGGGSGGGGRVGVRPSSHPSTRSRSNRAPLPLVPPSTAAPTALILPGLLHLLTPRPSLAPPPPPPNHQPYVSPLLMFASSRLMPHFKQVSGGMGLTSPTFCHALDPDWPLCPYEMAGECRNPACTFQSSRTYALSLPDRVRQVSTLAKSAGGSRLLLFKLGGQEIGEDEEKAEDVAERMVGVAGWRGVMLGTLKRKATERKEGEMEMMYASQGGVGERRARSLPPKAVEPNLKTYSGLLGATFTRQFASPLLRALGRTPLVALRCQAMLGETALPGEVLPGPIPPELAVALRRRQSGRYHQRDASRRGGGEDGNGEWKGVPGAYVEPLRAEPKQPELWAIAAMERLGWHHDGSTESMERLEQALKVLAKGLESNHTSELLWILHVKLYKAGPLTQRRTSKAETRAYLQAALRFAGSYRLWQAAVEITESLPQRVELLRHCMNALMMRSGGGGVASEGVQSWPEAQADCVLDCILYLLVTWCAAGDQHAAIHWVQGLLLAAEPSADAEGSAFQKYNAILSGFGSRQRVVLWLAVASVAGRGGLPDCVSDRLGHSQRAFVLSWERAEVSGVPFERQQVVSAALTAAVKPYQALLERGAKVELTAEDAAACRAALLSAFCWRGHGGLWEGVLFAGERLSLAQEAARWAARLHFPLPRVSPWLARLAAQLECRPLLALIGGFQAGDTTARPWTKHVESTATSQAGDVSQMAWLSYASAALRLDGQDTAICVLVDGAAASLRSRHPSAFPATSEDAPSPSSTWRVRGRRTAAGLWRAVEGPMAKARLPAEERCSALLNLALLEILCPSDEDDGSGGGRTGRAFSLARAIADEGGGAPELSELIWEEHLAAALEALNADHTPRCPEDNGDLNERRRQQCRTGGSRRARWAALLELIVAMVRGTRTRATPCEWPKLEVEDGRLSAVVDSAATVDSGWAVELLLRSAVPRLMRREAVEMVEAVVEAVPGCPAAARLAVAMLRICCGEGSNERGSVEVHWALPLAVEAVASSQPPASDACWLELVHLAARHCPTAAAEVLGMGRAVHPLSAALTTAAAGMELSGQRDEAAREGAEAVSLPAHSANPVDGQQ